MTAHPMPAGSGRPASIRCRRRSSRRFSASAARPSRCAAPGAPMPACMPPGRWRMSIWPRTGRPTRCATRVNAHLRLAGETVSVLPPQRRPTISTRASRRPARHYLYRILNRRAPPALEKNRAWWVPATLDADAMHEAAQTLVGRHDFTTFRSIHCQAKSPVRTLDRLDVTRDRRHRSRSGPRRDLSCTTRCARWSAR